MPKTKLHIPVMRNELLKYLQLSKDETMLDCTVGCAGHADALLKEIGPGGRLIGIDQDSQALEIAKQRLGGFDNYILIKGNFRNLDTILMELRISKVDGIIFDLGVSSLHFDSAERGFSIMLDAPLDMRMDRNLRLSAFDLVNFLPLVQLSEIFRKYGEERWHKRIAQAIVRERKKNTITSTKELAELVKRAIPKRHRYIKIHPATRSFQALRIAVNDELAALSEGVVKCIDYLRPAARICVISFHSLEDRIIKQQFRKFSKEGKLRLISKKPITATRQEILSNPRSRSAKLRVAEKLNTG